MSTTLEHRIADALKADDVKSEDLVALIAETEAAVAAADEAATKTREQALDPLISPDATKARAAMESAAFTPDRLRTVLPRLQQRLQEVQAQEYAAQWRADFDEAATVRDALAVELNETYPAIVATISDLMTRIGACDREAARINGSAPSGEHLRLRGVELSSRNLAGFTRAAPSILEELKLPPWEPGGQEWPVSVPFSAAMAAAIAPVPFNPRYSADWHKVKAAEAEAQREQHKLETKKREAEANANWRGPKWWEGARTG